MAANDVMLLGASSSPFVNRVQFALNLKSVDYEYLLEHLPQKSELLLKSNPVHKKIPVLIHGDKPICESLLILQYIDDVWSYGPSILPSEPYDRATTRFWAAYLDDKWLPLFKDLRLAKEKQSKAAFLEKILEGLKFLEDVFVKSSKGNGFFGGETIGYLDCVLGSFLGWVKVMEIIYEVIILDENKTPGLVGWAESFRSHPATQGVIPEPEQLINVLKRFVAREPAAASK